MKSHTYDSIDMKCPEQANPERQKTHSCLPEAGGKGKRECELTKYRVSFGGDKTILELGSDEGCTML